MLPARQSPEVAQEDQRRRFAGEGPQRHPLTRGVDQSEVGHLVADCECFRHARYRIKLTTRRERVRFTASREPKPPSRGHRRVKTYDLVILGGGTGGLVSAHIAAGLGARVALLERDRPGGDCLWTGCVPSKSLIAAASLAHRMRHADRVGLLPVEPEIDFATVMAHVRNAQAKIEPQDSPERLRAAGVEVISGAGVFSGPRSITVGDRELRFRRAIIATGSDAVVPPVPELAEAKPLTSENVWQLEELPRRLLVVGGGPIGCELGQAFARLGSSVVQIESGQRLLPRDDPRAAQLILKRFGAEGIDVRLEVSLESVEPGEAGSGVATLSGGDRIPFDRILVTTGRSPRTGELQLRAAGVEVDKHNGVALDERLRTSNSAIYAVGDVTGRMPFTHVAAMHARVAVPNALFGLRRRAEHDGIPWVTFTDPEVAQVGLTHEQARGRWGARAKSVDFDYAELDRAITAGEITGFARLVGDPNGRLVGATIVAASGGEAIAELTAWIAQGAKIDAVSGTVHAYPTFGEGPARAADEHVRRRLLNPRVRRLARPALALGRLLAR